MKAVFMFHLHDLSIKSQITVIFSARPNTVSFWWYWHRVAHMCCLSPLFWLSVLVHLLYLDPIILPWVKRIFSAVASSDCFWKTKSKHHLAQQKLGWKFLLDAAWGNRTVGILSGLWLVALHQRLCSYHLFPFFIAFYLGSTSCKMCIIL